MCGRYANSWSNMYANLRQETCRYGLIPSASPPTGGHAPGGFDIDEVAIKLLNVGTPDQQLEKTVSFEEIHALCTVVKTIFLGQPSLLEIGAPVKVAGDTHGQYGDVLRLLNRGGFPPYTNYLFLGDYVDGGKQSLEVILLYFCFKAKYPVNFFMLRGNHECAAINRVYGFYRECIARYPESPDLWQIFQDVFSCMPLVGLIGGSILCMHGGLSPNLKSLSQLRDLRRPLEVNPEKDSLEMDLLWADPDLNAKDWQPSSRGVSFVFGPSTVDRMTAELDIDLVARGGSGRIRQVVQDGYQFFANKKLVTIFSAPHYCGEFDNSAAMMVVDKNLVCSFQVMRPTIMKTIKVAAK